MRERKIIKVDAQRTIITCEVCGKTMMFGDDYCRVSKPNRNDKWNNCLVIGHICTDCWVNLVKNKSIGEKK